MVWEYWWQIISKSGLSGKEVKRTKKRRSPLVSGNTKKCSSFNIEKKYYVRFYFTRISWHRPHKLTLSLDGSWKRCIRLCDIGDFKWEFWRNSGIKATKREWDKQFWHKYLPQCPQLFDTHESSLSPWTEEELELDRRDPTQESDSSPKKIIKEEDSFPEFITNSSLHSTHFVWSPFFTRVWGPDIWR